MVKVLLVIADEKARAELSKILVDGNFEVSSNAFIENLPEQVKVFDPDLIFIDAHLVEDAAPKIRQEFPQKPILAWLGQKNARLAIGFMVQGALDCLCPPINPHEVQAVVRHILNQTVTKDSPIPEPKKNYLPLVRNIGIGAVILLSILSYVLLHNFASSKSKTFTLTYQNPTGVCWIKNRLWTSDWYTQSVYNYKLGGEIKLLKIYSFPEFNPNTLAIINDMLWVTGTDGFIRTYQIINNVPTITNTFKSPGVSPSGLCVQGKFIWSTDIETRKVYQHLLTDPEQIVAAFDYPGQEPVGIYWDGKNFWSADGKTNKVYRHAGPDKQFEITGTFALAPEGGGMLAGMSGDGRNIWLIFTSQPAKILRYPINKLK
jgi:DNA-binding response OmpR family regulator